MPVAGAEADPHLRHHLFRKGFLRIMHNAWLVAVLVFVVTIGVVGFAISGRADRSGQPSSTAGPEATELDAQEPLEWAQSDVERFGWHIVAVEGGAGEPGYLFTIGLWRTYRHPEVLLIVPSSDPMVLAKNLHAVGQAVSRGQRFEPGTSYPGLMGKHPGMFRPIHVSWYPLYLETALGFYGSEAFPVIQQFWPDGNGRFPWQDGFDEGSAGLQPRLEEFEVGKANLPPRLAAEFSGLDGFDFRPETVLVDPGSSGTESSLAPWRWLIGEDTRLLGVTLMGDVFLQDPKGKIRWLDTGQGQVERVAENEEEWRRMLPSHGPRWLHAEVLEQLRAAGIELPPGQVFSWRLLPMLGGSLSPDNIDMVPPAVHLTASGRQAQALGHCG
ncbi:MAG: DUF4262 domain-containing protein [Acidobacteria bacterium]|nr:DUF4262 domain-containing protein [Acidobacteriota bacterium]